LGDSPKAKAEKAKQVSLAEVLANMRLLCNEDEKDAEAIAGALAEKYEL
jgi:hypothetical protein